MSLEWTLGQIAELGEGWHLIGPAETTVTSVCTDSRRLTPGCLFVALVGDRFDGHDYAAAARQQGAAAVMVAGPLAVEPRLEVPHTLEALRLLAIKRRGELRGRVVAISGSTGKTTTKDLLAAALGPGTAASPSSFNNEIGVPLTVLATPTEAPALVVEVGSRGSGHIRHLMPAVRPQVAILTSVGVAHFEMFEDTDRLLEAKWELIEGLEAGGVAVLPADDDRLRSRAEARDGDTLFFAVDRDADVVATDLELGENGRPAFELRAGDDSVRVQLSIVGLHQARNAAAAAAAALALGRSLDQVAAGLEKATGPPARMEIHRGRFTVVNDAYNSNPESLQAALESVARLPGRRLAVLGRMAELGSAAAPQHRRLGELARQLGFEQVVIVGEDPGLAAGAGPVATAVADQDEAAELLARVVEEGDVVLVKASLVVGLQDLSARLIEEART